MDGIDWMRVGKVVAGAGEKSPARPRQGFTNFEIVRRVFLVNVGLVALAALSVVDATA